MLRMLSNSPNQRGSRCNAPSSEGGFGSTSTSETEHILLGLIKEELGVAGVCLKKSRRRSAAARHEVEKIIQPGDDPITSETLTLTPSAEIAVAYAMEEAGDLHHDYVGTPHLLLGLRRDEYSVASQIFMNCDVELEALRQEAAKLLVQPE